MKILENHYLKIFVLIIALFAITKNLSALEGLCYKVDKAGKKVYIRCYCNCYPQGYTQRGRCARCLHFVNKTLIYMPPKFRAK